MSVTLDQARIISEAALAKARELGLKPISVTIMDPRTSLVACLSEEGVSQMRWRIAQRQGKCRNQAWLGHPRIDGARRTASLFHSSHERTG